MAAYREETLSLYGQVMQNSGITDRVKKILSESKEDPSLVGERLWQTLVMSGVALGIDEVASYFADKAHEHVRLLREVNKAIGNAIMSTDDFDALKTLNESKKTISDMLQKRAEMLKDMHVNQVKENFDIPADILLADTPIDEIDFKELERIGLYSLRNNVSYVLMWLRADKNNKVPSIAQGACGCMKCLHNLVGHPNDKDLFLMAEREGGVSKALRDFGAYIIEESRNNYAKAVEGADNVHTGGGIEDAKDAAIRMIEGLRKFGQ